MKHNVYIYILVMALITYAIRVIPLTLIHGEIKNKVIKSFLYYVPYVTLAVMTFPSVLTATDAPVSAVAAFGAAVVAAWKGKSLFFVAILSCVVVFAVETVML